MFTACGNNARDDHEQAATCSMWLETQAKRKHRPVRFPPDAPNITSLTAVLFTDRRYLTGICFVDLNPLWPLTPGETTLEKLCDGKIFFLSASLSHTDKHTLMAEVVSCRWQRTEGHWWFLTLEGEAFSLWPVVFFCSSAVTYCTRLQHRPQQSLHHHGYHWLSSSVGHYLSY